MTWEIGIFIAVLFALWTTLDWHDVTRTRERIERDLYCQRCLYGGSSCEDCEDGS